MRTTKVLSTLFAVVSLATVSFAADVVGKWAGKMEVVSDKGVVSEMKVQGGSMPALTLEIRADKSYTGTQTGGPGNQKHTADGKWKLQGNTLTLTPLKRDGKPATADGAKPRVYTVSSDGKTLSIDLTAQFKAAAKVSGDGASKFKARLVLKRTK